MDLGQNTLYISVGASKKLAYSQPYCYKYIAYEGGYYLAMRIFNVHPCTFSPLIWMGLRGLKIWLHYIMTEIIAISAQFGLAWAWAKAN